MATKAATGDGSDGNRNSRACGHNTIDLHLAGKCTECDRDTDERTEDAEESRADHKLVLGPHEDGGVMDESWVGISWTGLAFVL